MRRMEQHDGILDAKARGALIPAPICADELGYGVGQAVHPHGDGGLRPCDGEVDLARREARREGSVGRALVEQLVGGVDRQIGEAEALLVEDDGSPGCDDGGHELQELDVHELLAVCERNRLRAAEAVASAKTPAKESAHASRREHGRSCAHGDEG